VARAVEACLEAYYQFFSGKPGATLHGWKAYIDALKKIVAAVRKRCPEAELLHHSDRGSQYASKLFQDKLGDYGMVCSMSRKGNCWDNAPTESFFNRMKNERVHGTRYETRSEATTDLFDYIELRTNMTEAESQNIFRQVVDAIHHLHTKALVVHRDIKDENVVLDGEGRIKLIDFGSAAYIKNGPFDVFVGTIGGCEPYLRYHAANLDRLCCPRSSPR